MVAMPWCVKAGKRFQLIVSQKFLHCYRLNIKTIFKEVWTKSLILGSAGEVEEIARLKLSARVLGVFPYPRVPYKEPRTRCQTESRADSSTRIINFFNYQDASQIYLRFGLDIVVNCPECSNLREQRHLSWKLGW